MQGVLVYPPFTPHAGSNNKVKLPQDRISSMDNMYFYRTRNWDDPPPMIPTCYVKPAVKPLYRPYEVCIIADFMYDWAKDLEYIARSGHFFLNNDRISRKIKKCGKQVNKFIDLFHISTLHCNINEFNLYFSPNEIGWIRNGNLIHIPLIINVSGSSIIK